MAPKPDSSPEAIAADVELLKSAIKASGAKSTRSFAHGALARDDRTVRKWLQGETTLPHFVREKCHEIVRAARRRARSAGAAAALLVLFGLSIGSGSRRSVYATSYRSVYASAYKR